MLAHLPISPRGVYFLVAEAYNPILWLYASVISKRLAALETRLTSDSIEQHVCLLDIRN